MGKRNAGKEENKIGNEIKEKEKENREWDTDKGRDNKGKG